MIKYLYVNAYYTDFLILFSIVCVNYFLNMYLYKLRNFIISYYSIWTKELFVLFDIIMMYLFTG